MVVVKCSDGLKGDYELLIPWNSLLCLDTKATEANIHVLRGGLARHEHLIPLEALDERQGQGFPSLSQSSAYLTLIFTESILSNFTVSKVCHQTLHLLILREPQGTLWGFYDVTLHSVYQWLRRINQMGA